ncbi:MAG: lambda family phage portal protein [Halioglobus sp.]|jgi:lambda family phage portal protein
MPKESLLSRAILAASPSWAASRAKGRREFQQHEAAARIFRKYEAASTGRRNDGWSRPGTSANAEIATSATALRNGARQLVRDNGLAANAVNVLENNVIGTGIRPSFTAHDDATEKMLGELWEEHVASESSGAEETGNFYDRQGLAFRAIVESGSVLQRRRRRSSGSGGVLPYQVQLLEPDYLNKSKDGAYKGNTVTHGKEYNKRGDVVAYHLYTSHPGDNFIGITGLSGSTRVLASEISHAYRMDRPGQADGATWFAPIMTDLRELADTRGNYQLRQKIASCYTVFLHESEPGQGTSHKGSPTSEYMEPGRIESLPPGKDVSFANPPSVTGMSDFDRDILLTIAAGLGVPYEALTGNLKDVNFLSGRMGWLAFYRNIETWRTRIVVPKLCKTELQWFLQSTAAARGISAPVRVNWTAPHRDLLDPTKEIKALREEMRLGALAYPDMVAMRGRDPKQVLDDIEKWNKEIEKKNLYFDWDVPRVSMAGNANITATIEEE